MQKLKLRVYPDDFLKRPSKKLKEVKQNHILTAIRMNTLMNEYKGIGISAPQVGVDYAVIVINTLGKKFGVKRTMFNPEIIESSIDTFPIKEGCLSFPEEYIDTKRSNKIRVKYLNGKNEEVTEEFEGISAVCVAHEIDHLNGVLFIELDKKV